MFSTGGPPSLPLPPRCRLFDTTHPELVFYVSHNEDDKEHCGRREAFERWIKLPSLRRGYVFSCCVVFITAMFTFISTCLKCVTIPFPSLSRVGRSRYPPRLCAANRCYRAKEMFCLPSISKAHGSVKTLLVRVHRRYCSFKST